MPPSVMPCQKILRYVRRLFSWLIYYQAFRWFYASWQLKMLPEIISKYSLWEFTYPKFKRLSSFRFLFFIVTIQSAVILSWIFCEIKLWWSFINFWQVYLILILVTFQLGNNLDRHSNAISRTCKIKYNE